MRFLTAIFISLIGFSTISMACTNQDLPTGAPPTSVLAGVEIVKTIPPTAEGDDPESLNPDGPRRGGVLAAPLSWCRIHDPAIDAALGAFIIESAPLVTEIHAGLTKLSDDANTPVHLELADSYDVRENGLLYEFVLRQDLKFSDGSPLTASDVKWSWERAINLSETAGRARDVFGLIDGARAVIDGESSDLTGVNVVDDRTLKIHLTQPRAEFSSLMADPVASVLKKDNVSQWMTTWEADGSEYELGPTDQDNLPVGAGPFKLVDYSIGSDPGHCAIARNPHYWGRPAYLDGVWFRPEVMIRETERTGSDVMTMIETDPLAFVNEEADYESTDYVVQGSEADYPPNNLIEVEGSEMFEYEPVPTISFLVLNAAAPPFDDVHFRRAVVASADVESVVRGSKQHRRLITDDLTTLELTDVHPEFDPELAATHRIASRYSEHDDQWELGYLMPNSFFFLYELDGLFNTWNEKLDLKVEEDPFGHDVIDEFGGRNNTKYHFRMYHVVPAYPDPSTVLRAIVSPFGEIGKAPEFVELENLLNAAAVELDGVKRHEMYLEIENYLADQALVIPIEVVAGSESYRVHPWVHDLKPPEYPGSVFYNVWLDHRAPKRELPTR